MKLIDVLIDGPFDITQRDITLPLRGSPNQRIIDVQASLQLNKTILIPDSQFKE
jgi:anaerobic ribonucleoside-triphosphate reductase activating protein